MAEAKKKLTLKQKEFGRLYATKRELFGNGTQAYMQAFGLEERQYGTARVEASKLLTNPNVLAYIREIMETAVLNDEFVDNQMAFCIEQNADMAAKTKSIAEYNKLKSRIDNKLKVEVDSPAIITIISNAKGDSVQADS